MRQPSRWVVVPARAGVAQGGLPSISRTLCVKRALVNTSARSHLRDALAMFIVTQGTSLGGDLMLNLASRDGGLEFSA